MIQRDRQPFEPKASWLDRAISFVSPETALRRRAARIINSYQSGVPTRDSEGWQPATANRFGNASDRQQLLTARDRAYQAFRNNPLAQTIINTETDNVISDGLNYQPTTDSEEWNREAKDKYWDWLESCSVRGPDIEDGCSIQRMIWSHSRIAGDVGWVLVARGFDSKIQVVRSENIQTPDGQYGDATIYDGIKYDEFGAPLAFYVLSQNDQKGQRAFATIQARDFVYLPHMTEPGQSRGVTGFNTIFDLLGHLNRYVDGVSLAAWMATVFGVIFKEATAGNQFTNLPLLKNSQGNNQRAITLENGGQVKYMAPEGEVVQVDAKQPMQNTPAFITAMYRMIGQPFDMPLEVLAKDMSTVNFASARIGLLPFYRACRIKANKFGVRWGRTIRWWLSRERQRADDDPKKWKSAWPEKYWGHDLLINAWPYTDPVSEAQADLLQMDMGTKSPQMVINERGLDAEQILRERAEWVLKTAEFDEVHSTMTRDPTPEPVATPTVAGPDPELERIKGEADAYGVAVRAGVITPQQADEEDFRTKLKLPPVGTEVAAAWNKDEGTRRPITITPPPGTPAPAPFGGGGNSPPPGGGKEQP